MKSAQQKKQSRRGTAFFGRVMLPVLLTAALLVRCGAKHWTAGAKDTPSLPAVAPIPALQEELPDGWERVELPQSALSEGNLVLVNADHGFDAAAARTVPIYDEKTDSYLVAGSDLSVTAETMQALNRWMDAFSAQTGVTDVNIVAGWRSEADQTELYDNAVFTKGQAHADAYIALPGHSEHHTGLAVDLDTYDLESGVSGGFDGDGAYAWAAEHAWEYGFIQRYPPGKSEVTGISFESWHYRYVGLPHSYIMSTENLCLEEYINYLRSYPFSGQHLFVECLGQSYEIYCCAGSEIAVPAQGEYTVSGDNAGGMIVTVRR